MPTIKMTSQGPKTSSYTIAREECEVGCILMRDKCSKSTPAHVAIQTISKTSFQTKWVWILLSLPQTTRYCCHNIPNQCWPLYIVKTFPLQWQQFINVEWLSSTLLWPKQWCIGHLPNMTAWVQWCILNLHALAVQKHLWDPGSLSYFLIYNESSLCSSYGHPQKMSFAM